MPVTKKCAICSGEFKVKPSHAHKRVCCSRECCKDHRRKIMSGSKNHQYGRLGEDNGSWKGGKRINNFGYVLVYCPEYSRRSDYYALEHRVIIQKELGRRLRRREVVHHINGDRTDNRRENLQLMTLSEHTQMHSLDTPAPQGKDGRFVKKVIREGYQHESK